MAMNFDSTWVQSVRTLLQQGHFAEAVAHTGRALRSPGNDTNGRLVFTQDVVSGEVNLDVSGLRHGTYRVDCVSETSIMRASFVKQ